MTVLRWIRRAAGWVNPSLAAAVVLAFAPSRLRGQDVEMLGERYGTRPPQAYYDQLDRDPMAYQFVRGRPARMRAAMAAAAGTGRDVLRVLGPRDGPVRGTVRVPVVLGLFSDSPVAPAFTLEEIDEAYFSGDGATIKAYYTEVSGGRVTLEGSLYGWVRSAATRASATGGSSGLTYGTTGAFIVDLLGQLDGVDWGLYDNDGPDGLPNSGDDDGYVDALAVLQPTAGAECGGGDQDNRIWSHRWNLQSASGSWFTTATPSAGGGFIKIDDYTVQATLDCNGEVLSEVGTFTHELGHAFGLPDLYDTFEGDGAHGGAGVWDLMASGGWGCDRNTPESPCHMSAWSKATLGWVDVVTLAPGTDHGTLTLPPVETSGTVYRVDAQDGSGEYFLLENRQRTGFDQRLLGEGLLIWQIDPAVIQSNWAWNGVNAYAHMGVWLRQADGLDELGQVGGGRGDRNDPFPEVSSGNDVFHAASAPASLSYPGGVTGLTITDVTREGDDISLRLSTRFSTLTVRSEGDGGDGGLLVVDGAPVAGTSHTFPSAPFQEHLVEAAVGEPLEPGHRRAFDGWDDDAEAPRVRTVVTPYSDLDLVARYGALELQLSMAVTGGVGGIDPGSFVAQPVSDDLWFEEGAQVQLQAVPQTGFAFQGWTGDLAGQPNPALFAMTAPLSAGAEFELTYAVPSVDVPVEAAAAQNIQLAVENGTAPFFWTFVDGVMPQGLTVNANGQVTGAALETGDFPVTLQARDAIGLSGEALITFRVTTPDLGLDLLASDFLSVGPALTGDQRRFLDRRGNNDGAYDLGDFRAWVLAHPGLPLSAMLQALVADPEIVQVPLGLAGGGEGGR